MWNDYNISGAINCYINNKILFWRYRFSTLTNKEYDYVTIKNKNL